MRQDLPTITVNIDTLLLKESRFVVAELGGWNPNLKLVFALEELHHRQDFQSVQQLVGQGCLGFQILDFRNLQGLLVCRDLATVSSRSLHQLLVLAVVELWKVQLCSRDLLQGTLSDLQHCLLAHGSHILVLLHPALDRLAQSLNFAKEVGLKV